MQRIQGEVPWCTLFEEDIVLIDKTCSGVRDRVVVWRQNSRVQRVQPKQDQD